MSDRADKVKAGIFVLISLLLLIGSVAVIAGLRFLKSTKTYYVQFTESVTGLESSSTVRYNGVPVGRVSDIGFAPNEFPKIRVTIEVRPETPIRPGTIATLKPQGITGVYYIDLSGGREGEPLLPAGSTLAAGNSLSVQITETLSEFQQVVTKLNAILSENRESIGNTVSKIEEAAGSFGSSLGNLDNTLNRTADLATSLHQTLTETIRSADETIVSLRDLIQSEETQAIPGKVVGFLDQADGVARDVREEIRAADVKGTLAKIRELADRMVELETEVAGAVREVRTGISDNRGMILRMTADLREFAQNLKLISRELKREPSRLLFGQPRSDRRDGDR